MIHWELGIFVHILDLVTTIVLFLQRIGKEFFIHFHAWISRAYNYLEFNHMLDILACQGHISGVSDWLDKR